MCQLLTLDKKLEIIESFNNYTSWIDDEKMGMSIVNDINYQKARQHLIPNTADILSLFWDSEPFATESTTALNFLREKYCMRMQKAFRDNIVTNIREYDAFVEKEKQYFIQDWNAKVDNFDWEQVQDNAINKLLSDVASNYQNLDISTLRRTLIKLYPGCSSYEVTSDEAIIKLEDMTVR
ncbi:hypothetical protein ACWCL1_08050 [Ligilactobacillus sp. LYQ135]